MNSFPNKAKKSITCFLLALVAALTTYGMPFYGTITQTVTNTNDPTFHVGQTVTGWYQYESDDTDGVFAANFWGGAPQNGTPALCGSIFSFVNSPSGGDGWVSLRGSISRFAELTVDDNCVSDFHYFTNVGYSYLAFGLSSFGVSTSYFDRAADKWIDYSTGGTICFSAPVAAVPEATTTASLVALSFLGLIILRRRFGQ